MNKSVLDLHLNSLDKVNNDRAGPTEMVAFHGSRNFTNGCARVIVSRWKYKGQGLDSETGLQFKRARYLEQRSGRWTSQDPLAFEGGDNNFYRYVRNAPTIVSDPTGDVLALSSVYIIKDKGAVPHELKNLKWAKVPSTWQQDELGPYNGYRRRIW